jgi:hypothetical protein
LGGNLYAQQFGDNIEFRIDHAAENFELLLKIVDQIIMLKHKAVENQTNKAIRGTSLRPI